MQHMRFDHASIFMHLSKNHEYIYNYPDEMVEVLLDIMKKALY